MVTQGNDSATPGKRVTTEVFVEGKRKRFPQSIQWQTKLHCEKHLLTNTAGSSIEESHSSALYWWYFFSRDFDNATRASGAVVELSQRKHLMEWYVSHSDVKSYGICKTAKSYGICKTALGPRGYSAYEINNIRRNVKWENKKDELTMENSKRAGRRGQLTFIHPY